MMIKKRGVFLVKPYWDQLDEFVKVFGGVPVLRLRND